MIGKPNTVKLSLEAIADHVKTTGHNIKWDHFGQSWTLALGPLGHANV